MTSSQQTLIQQPSAQQHQTNQSVVLTWPQTIWRFISARLPWQFYNFPFVQRAEVKFINTIYFKFPFFKKNNKWTSSAITDYGDVRGCT
jgi:hypothetical protein